jgi:hypothetical protein
VYSLNGNGSQYSDDRSAETRLDLVVRDEAQDRSVNSSYPSKKYLNPNFREDSLTPTTESELTKSAPSSFILQETSSYCLSHTLPKPIPKFSGFGDAGAISRPELNGGPKFNGYDNRMPEYQNHQFTVPEPDSRTRNTAELHRAHLVSWNT